MPRPRRLVPNPGPQEALRTPAEQEHRSIANTVEVMIREYCGWVAMAPQLIIGSNAGARKRKTANRRQERNRLGGSDASNESCRYQ